MGIEDRKYALEKALEISKDDPDKAIGRAQAFYEFIQSQDIIESDDKKKIIDITGKQRSAGENRIDHKLKEITTTQKAILSKAIELYHAGEWVNGSKIARSLKPACSQSNASLHLLKLIEAGYVIRKGNNFTPIFTPRGAPVPVNVKEMPRGLAKGYKGHALTYKLQDAKKVTNGHAAY